jgi:hypothetical protein
MINVHRSQFLCRNNYKALTGGAYPPQAEFIATADLPQVFSAIPHFWAGINTAHWLNGRIERRIQGLD